LQTLGLLHAPRLGLGRSPACVHPHWTNKAAHGAQAAEGRGWDSGTQSGAALAISLVAPPYYVWESY
jgi:hypothetical protein